MDKQKTDKTTSDLAVDSAPAGSAIAHINAKCCETCASWNSKADGFCVKHGFPTEAREYCIEHRQNERDMT